MSSLRPIDMRFIDDAMGFFRGAGYVLDFSDATFASFFEAELDIDIDDPTYADLGGSKGKRLRCFLGKVDDATAARALRALWTHRAEILATRRIEDRVHNAEGRFLSLIARLEGATDGGTAPAPVRNRGRLLELRDQLNALHALGAQARGYAFETFLKDLFDLFGLSVREPFRNVGEQIDGSFVLGHETYLLEAKWQNAPTPAADLRAFHGKLVEKADWTRGLFVSFNGFSPDGLTAYGSAKRLICMEGRDIYEALDREIPLDALLERKVRRAAETGQPFVPVSALFPVASAPRSGASEPAG